MHTLYCYTHTSHSHYTCLILHTPLSHVYIYMPHPLPCIYIPSPMYVYIYIFVCSALKVGNKGPKLETKPGLSWKVHRLSCQIGGWSLSLSTLQ